MDRGQQFPEEGAQARTLTTPMGTWVGVQNGLDEHGFPKGVAVGVSPGSWGPPNLDEHGDMTELFHYNYPKMHTLFATKDDPHVGAAIQLASDAAKKLYGSVPEADTSLSETSLPLMRGLSESGVVRSPEGGFPESPTNDYTHDDSRQIVPEKLQQIMGAKESTEVSSKDLSDARKRLHKARKSTKPKAKAKSSKREPDLLDLLPEQDRGGQPK